MSETVIPLPLSCRTSDDDYPGKLAQLGADWRLCVSMDANRFSLHERMACGSWRPAGGNSPGTLRAILEKYGDRVDGLAALCATLPNDPGRAAPEFLARRRAQLAMIQAAREAKHNPADRRRASPKRPRSSFSSLPKFEDDDDDFRPVVTVA